MQIKTIILLASLAVSSCQQQEKEVKQEQAITKEQPTQAIEKHFANAVLIEGSSFGVFVQSLYLNNQFKTLLAFTSARTKAKYGSKQLLNFYQNKFEFAYKLGRLSNTYQQGDTIILCYNKAYKFATRKKISIPCVIENDTVKLLLYDLNKTPFE